MPKRYRVRLVPEERERLEALIARSPESFRDAARTLTHARILLQADEGEAGPAWKNAAIADALEISALTVTRVRKRFVEEGLDAALRRKEQINRAPRRLDGAQEAHLIALAGSEPPEGRARWTLRLLAEKRVELNHGEEVSYETIRRVLKRGT